MVLDPTAVSNRCSWIFIIKNLLDWKKALERIIKLSKPLEKCSHQEAKLAGHELMLDVGQMMFICGANVARAMDTGPYNPFYNPSPAIAHIMDDFCDPLGNDLNEHFFDSYGVAREKALMI